MQGVYTLAASWLVLLGCLPFLSGHRSKATLRAFLLAALAGVLALGLAEIWVAQGRIAPLGELAPALSAAGLLAGFYTPAFSARPLTFLVMLALHALGQTVLLLPSALVLSLAPPAGFLLLALAMPRLRRLLLSYGLAASMLLLFAGVSADLGLHPTATFFGLPGVALLLGLFPLAAWYPRLFERASPGLLASFFALQTVLAFALQGRLGLEGDLPAALSLGLALLGLLMALGQEDSRRALAGIAGSQLAFLVYAGLGQAAAPAALILAQAQLISMPGLILSLGVLEMRRGELSLLRPSGQYDSYPKLATAILLFGLMGAGFPLSLAYTAEDLVLATGFQASPWLATGWLAVAALNALAVMKMYLYLCHGRRGREPGIDILPAKLAAAVCAIGFLILATLLL